jgi:phospholipid/cholesterol/gamma-HCH transport system substrate-binding protein
MRRSSTTSVGCGPASSFGLPVWRSARSKTSSWSTAATGCGSISTSTTRSRCTSPRPHRFGTSTGGYIPLSRTSPALDLDALIGGFKPLFRALDPEKVNNIATSIITVFQGQGGTINDILDQTAQLTSHIAERDQAIGEVVKNLNIVLDTTVKHRAEFDSTVDNFEKLISGLNTHAEPFAEGTANISNAAGTVADLLADNRTLLHKTLDYLQPIQQTIIDQKDLYDDQLKRTPIGLNIEGNAAGNYGDWVNFYLCDLTLKTNGLQGGGPVRKVKVWSQPTGRCTPQ